MPNRSSPPARNKNVRTALALLSVVAVFFFGVLAAHVAGVNDRGMMVLGVLIVVFLVVAIGRNLRNRQ